MWNQCFFCINYKRLGIYACQKQLTSYERQNSHDLLRPIARTSLRSHSELSSNVYLHKMVPKDCDYIQHHIVTEKPQSHRMALITIQKAFKCYPNAFSSRRLLPRRADERLLYHYPKYAIVIGPTRVTWYVQIITVDRCSAIRGNMIYAPRATWSRGCHPMHSRLILGTSIIYSALRNVDRKLWRNCRFVIKRFISRFFCLLYTLKNFKMRK